jgi:hypothetical protein
MRKLMSLAKVCQQRAGASVSRQQLFSQFAKLRRHLRGGRFIRVTTILDQQLKFGIAKITHPEVKLDCDSIAY